MIKQEDRQSIPRVSNRQPADPIIIIDDDDEVTICTSNVSVPPVSSEGELALDDVPAVPLPDTGSPDVL